MKKFVNSLDKHEGFLIVILLQKSRERESIEIN